MLKDFRDIEGGAMCNKTLPTQFILNSRDQMKKYPKIETFLDATKLLFYYSLLYRDGMKNSGSTFTTQRQGLRIKRIRLTVK
jgi:hypothetical protein